MTEIIKIKNLHLAHTKEGSMSISHIEKPYGEYSEPVVRVSLTLHEDEKATSLDIPYDNIEEVIDALNKAKETCKSIVHNDVHAELLSDMGGGQ